MNEKRPEKQTLKPCWVGLDWGEQEHAVSIVDDERAVIDRFKIGVELKDLRRLAERFRQAGVVSGIAIEATCNPVLGYLASEGFTIYPVNPKMSANWRKSTSVACSKNDDRDGLVLAVELSRRHESLRVLTEMKAEVAELSGLCKNLRALIEQRTSLLQRLKAVLKQYFPGVLSFFSDWGSPVSWRFLKKYSNPGKLARVQKNTLIGFLKKNRIGMKPVWLERIDRRGEAAQWPAPQNSLSLEMMTMATVAQLQALQPHIAMLDKLIAENVKALPQASLVRSLPGAGDRLAPALTALVCYMTEGKEDLASLRCITGIAPVEASSGQRRKVKMRRRCNKFWRNTLHLYANSTLSHCAWAKAFYDLHRESGDGHASALRKLADKWLKILDRMLVKDEEYDDERYVEALRKHGSPVYARLCGKTCG